MKLRWSACTTMGVQSRYPTWFDIRIIMAAEAKMKGASEVERVQGALGETCNTHT